MAQTEDSRQQLIDMVQGNGRRIEAVQHPDGSTSYKLHVTHGGYHRTYDCSSKEEVQDIIDLMDSDI